MLRLLYCVYRHTNKFNNKVYIGITKRKPEDRWGVNGCNYKTSPHFYSAICKYGWDNFYHDILYNDISKEEACNKEIELIAYYDSMNPEFGYNMTTGGDCPTMSLASRKKLSESMQGNQNGFGKPCSREKADKISKAQIGKMISDETRKRQSIAAHNRHIPCSDKKRKKLQDSYPYKKKVFCLETQCVYKSVQECARQLGLHASLVSKTCKHKISHTGGYHLEYYDDMINA